jgi:hypothetical protein
VFLGFSLQNLKKLTSNHHCKKKQQQKKKEKRVQLLTLNKNPCEMKNKIKKLFRKN